MQDLIELERLIESRDVVSAQLRHSGWSIQPQAYADMKDCYRTLSVKIIVLRAQISNS